MITEQQKIPIKISLSVIADIKKNRLDKFLAHEFPKISRSKIQAMIESGFVSVNGACEKDANRHLKTKDLISVDCVPQIKTTNAPIADANVDFSVLYEDEDIIVVNKPYGIVVHPGAGNYEHTLVNGLVYHCENLSSGSDDLRPGIVHRIDKDTSGVLVAAKNDAAHARLAEQFQSHSIKRKYVCFCYGVPRIKSGKIETLIARDPVNRIKMAVSQTKGKNAITCYKVLKEFGTFDSSSEKFRGFAAKIECELHTGRTHQIRVHMSHIGHSLIGDSVYKKKNYALPKEIAEYVNKFPRQALHAYFLEFVHPTSQALMHFEADLPTDLQMLERQLEKIAKF